MTVHGNQLKTLPYDLASVFGYSGGVAGMDAMKFLHLGRPLALLSFVAFVAVVTVACDGIRLPSELQGPPGLQGDVGAVGPAGEPGATSPQGSRGPQGSAGSGGSAGPAGPAGRQGDTGAKGEQGPQGPEGSGTADDLADQRCPAGEFVTGITGGNLVCLPLPGIPTWYADTDRDGFGDPGISVASVTQPAGFVADATDCDDTNAGINPDALDPPGDGIDQDCDGIDLAAPTWYADTDGDGFGDPASSVASAIQPAEFVADNTDCDDTNGSINPNALDHPGDGIDQDCDGIDQPPTWYADTDGDGFGDPGISVTSATQPAEFVADNTDCDDTNGRINPNALDHPGDGIDQDCDGIDPPVPTWYADTDGDGFGDPAVSVASVTQPAGFVADNTDCNDREFGINPGVPDPPRDRIDRNCDGRDQ